MLGRFLRQLAGDAIVQMALAVLACWGACRLIDVISSGPMIRIALGPGGGAGADPDYSPPPLAVRASFPVAGPGGPAPGTARLVR
jgi:hypothetical protein